MLWRTKPKLTTLRAQVQPRSRNCPNHLTTSNDAKIAFARAAPGVGKGRDGALWEMPSFSPNTPGGTRSGAGSGTTTAPRRVRSLCWPRRAPAPREGTDPPQGPRRSSAANGNTERAQAIPPGKDEHPQRRPRWAAAGAASAAAKGGGGWEPWGRTPCIPRIQAF